MPRAAARGAAAVSSSPLASWTGLASSPRAPPPDGGGDAAPELEELFAPARTREEFVERVRRMWFADWRIEHANARRAADVKAMACCVLFKDTVDGIAVGRTGKSMTFATPHVMTNSLVFDEEGRIKTWKVYDKGSAEDVARIRKLYVGLAF